MMDYDEQPSDWRDMDDNQLVVRLLSIDTFYAVMSPALMLAIVHEAREGSVSAVAVVESILRYERGEI